MAKQGHRAPTSPGYPIQPAPADPHDPWTILGNQGWSQDTLLAMLARVLRDLAGAVGVVMPHYRAITDHLGIRF